MNPEQTKRLLTELFVDEVAAAEAAPCHTNQDDIAAYVEAELDGQDVSRQYPLLAGQLAACATCHEAYRDLKLLLEMERTGLLVEPPTAPQIDLSYLPNKSTPELTEPVFEEGAVKESTIKESTIDHVTWRAAELGKLIVTLTDDFIQSLQTMTSQSVTPQPTFLKSTTDDLFTVTSPTIASPAITDDLTVTVTARPMRRDPDHCTITVAADIPSRGGWPELGGTMVTLSVGGAEVETRYTDAFGKVVFDGIARDVLGQVAVVVAPS